MTVTAVSGDFQEVSSDLQRLRHNVRLNQIVYLPVGQLKSYTRSLRKRSDAARRALMASVSGFGVVLPILIDEHDVIIAGEGIVEAARSVGLLEVPTLRIEHLTDEEVRLLRIALNKLGEQSSWDKIELAAEFGELLSLEVELAYEVTGFETPEIDNHILAAATPDADPDDEQVELDGSGAAVTRLGDQWGLGQHRVLCGSSLEVANLQLLMEQDLARMVLTDAPYNVKIDRNVSGLGKNKHREFAQASGEMSEDEFIRFQCDSTRALASFCVDGALLYLFMDWRHIWEMMCGIREAKLSLLNLAVWIKSNAGMGAFYRSQHELCFIAKNGVAAHVNNVQLGRFGRNRSNCWHYAGVNSFGRDRDALLATHPTCKNVSMLADAIRDATHRGDIVLDGFLGSGSTLIAAERTGRVCRGVELDPLYVDAIVKRWEKATGGSATLLASGETFAEVAARRAEEDVAKAETARSDMARSDIQARARTRLVTAA